MYPEATGPATWDGFYADSPEEFTLPPTPLVYPSGRAYDGRAGNDDNDRRTPLPELKVEEPKCVAATGDFCGEGVLWDRDSQCVYWTDINRFLVHRYALKDKSLQTWFFSEPATAVLLTSRKDTLALSLGSGISLWEPESGAEPVQIFALPGWPKVRCNDAGVDPGGALWVGSMRNNVGETGRPTEGGGTDGVLYRVDASGEAQVWRRDLGISNTFVWNPDQSRFYFGDTLQNCIWSYEYSLQDRSITGEQPFFQGFDRGLPDGSAIDTDGYVWNCRYGGGCIVRVSPSGKIDRTIEMPVARPTNCTFGGEHGNVLYVTSASPAPGQWERFGGCLFALETNVTGVTENQFQLLDDSSA
ncbi:MAG: SMP-30/gluconolactonase/LRE family protein [Acidobacteriaceae bacterium]